MVGRLTRDPELKSTNNGKYYCRFSLASNRYDFGKKQDVAGFFDCVAWSKQAETISKYCSAGNRIGISGRLAWSSWQDSEGKKRSKVEIVVDNFQFLETKKDLATSQDSNPNEVIF